LAYLIPQRAFTGEIDYRLPINMQPEWEHLFRPDHEYKKVRLGARLLSNVFVNHYGLVINNGLLVHGCAPNIASGGYDDGFYLPHWKKAMEQMLVSRFGKSIESRNLDDDRTYLVIHSPWFSYYFWVTECIPRLLMVREHLHELVLIYPEHWDRFPFVRDTLSLFPELRVERVKQDVHLRVKTLVMPEVKPWTPMFIPEQVEAVRSLILSHTQEHIASASFGKRIHLSRADAPRKNYHNTSEVTELLDEFGFEHVTMTGRSIFEQARIIYGADCVVSITGAGMSNYTFLKNNTDILDVTNADYLHHSKYKFHFWKLGNIFNARYRVLFCPYNNDPLVPRFSLQNLIVNIPDMRTELSGIMTSGQSDGQ
jgi:capsular polysaccharide biosynthesis protein